MAALNNVRQLVQLCERTLGLNAVDARRVYRKVQTPPLNRHVSRTTVSIHFIIAAQLTVAWSQARRWYADNDISDLRYFDVVLHNHIPQKTRSLLTLQSWRQVRFCVFAKSSQNILETSIGIAVDTRLIHPCAMMSGWRMWHQFSVGLVLTLQSDGVRGVAGR